MATVLQCVNDCSHYFFPCSLQQAVAMKPRNTDALFALGEVHNDLKNYAKAQELWQKVVQLAPSHQEALSKLRQLR